MLNVVTGGSGDPPLLLTPGMAGTAHDWLPVVEDLARRHRLLRVERPGLGSAPPRAGVPSLREEAGALAAVAADVPGGVVLVAHSVAGLHAEAMTRCHPELVRGLVLLDPSCGPGRPGRPQRWRGAAERCGRAFADGAQHLGVTARLGPAAWSLLARGQTSRPVPEEVRRRGRAAFRSATAWTAAWQEYLAYPGMLGDLAALRQRTRFPAVAVRILTATAGTPSPAARRWRRCHRRLAGVLRAEHELLPAARHHLAWERPDRVVAAVAAVAGSGAAR
ncbi:hypothetical protein GCM10027174_26690 [Salinifilum aidingensis]